MTLTEIAQKLKRWVREDGVVIETELERSDIRPGEIVALNPFTVDVLGEGSTRVRWKNQDVTAAQVGDLVLLQKVGPAWVAVIRVEEI
jgi:hypothetical protein